MHGFLRVDLLPNKAENVTISYPMAMVFFDLVANVMFALASAAAYGKVQHLTLWGENFDCRQKRSTVKLNFVNGLIEGETVRLFRPTL